MSVTVRKDMRGGYLSVRRTTIDYETTTGAPETWNEIMDKRHACRAHEADGDTADRLTCHYALSLQARMMHVT